MKEECKMKIPVYKPLLGEEEIEYVVSAISRGEISGLYGEYIGKFEEEFSHYVGCSYGIAVSSGTAALHLALASLGIKQKDEIVVSSFTNMATFFAVLYQYAKPLPIDIEPDTWNINSALIEEKISERTKAILVAHIYGHPVDMDPVLKIAKKYGLYVIEDCAEAHGATYKGKKVGSLGDVGCFSFYANKIITTGEGGMLTTNNSEIADKARTLKSLAFGANNKFMHQDIGFNYRMTNIQAAIGCAQLKKIDKIIEKKRHIAHYYTENLKDVLGLQLPVEKSYAKNVYWMYHVVVHSENFGFTRDLLMEKLKDHGIETREAFIPYNLQKIFIQKGWVKGNECPVANYIARNGFYLPSSPLLKEKELKYIVNKIKDIKKDH
ncbi:DegT/DnrJ/EryC1/StrS aminotransferase family protein [Candidatus Hecatella orcuttiae]|uniref:DegT/DnrJ/EryC1/StrS family aminotransferase n=1 Tax=Candidatus Hecatella orcuttiae TaxID=1935119 RepID=UPI0028680742|nr:DegT/DnrJ/EryC1/StrS aminotransferase family protein [Candidatus Hecatella orcuttiae]